jgi:hypothetical protein
MPALACSRLCVALSLLCLVEPYRMPACQAGCARCGELSAHLGSASPAGDDLGELSRDPLRLVVVGHDFFPQVSWCPVEPGGQPQEGQLVSSNGLGVLTALTALTVGVSPLVARPCRLSAVLLTVLTAARFALALSAVSAGVLTAGAAC